MADLKISALTASTTPLAGTEVLPIVQSSTTKQVSVANLTAGRAVNVASLTATGIITAGSGIKSTTASGGQPEFVLTQTSVVSWTMYNPPSSTDLRLYNGLDRYTFESTGDLTLKTGNLVIGTSGKGIDFSATPGTGTSELLADYEEGDFTPTIAGSGTSGTGTYTTQVGKYTKVGRAVSFQVTLTWTNLTGASGILVINGLPYTSANVSGLATPVTTICDTVALTPLYYMQNFIFANSTQVAIRQFPSGGGAGAAVGLVTSGTIYLSGTYIV